MLAIKTLLSATDQLDTLIFDEIDSGISGRFAQIVGRKMREIANHHQLIVITHLPQIAAQGRTHFVVAKEEMNGRTKVSVNQLQNDDRVADIARLLGGEHITPEAMANARGLLNGAV
jgi:DNA repair protein RecN (Recombination protein N)